MTFSRRFKTVRRIVTRRREGDCNFRKSPVKCPDNNRSSKTTAVRLVKKETRQQVSSNSLESHLL
jgi:hypothetical protein